MTVDQLSNQWCRSNANVDYERRRTWEMVRNDPKQAVGFADGCT